MRSYDTTIYLCEKGKLGQDLGGPCYSRLSYNNVFSKDILISRFKENEVTDKQRQRLITLINRITPCEIVTIGKEEYIKFRMLHSYDSSLVLLNFIRYMWCEFKELDVQVFFEDLMKKGEKGQDALEKIMSSHILAINCDAYPPGHSNIQPKSKLKIKKKKALLEYKGSSTMQFMT